MSTLTIAVIIENNRPWPKFSAESLLAQIAIPTTEIEIFAKNSLDSSVEEFISIIGDSFPVNLTIFQNIQEVFLKLRHTNSQYLMLLGANNYATNNTKICDQISILENSDFHFCWHPVIFRRKSTLELLPNRNSIDYFLHSKAINPKFVPWQSLAIRVETFKTLVNEGSIESFPDLINQLLKNYSGQFLRQPSLIIQNSAGKGSFDDDRGTASSSQKSTQILARDLWDWKDSLKFLIYRIGQVLQ
jgi:hypothetical protein